LGCGRWRTMMVLLGSSSSFFFLQAEDGIRDRNVTGVQTCALPISCHSRTTEKWSGGVCREEAANADALAASCFLPVGVCEFQVCLKYSFYFFKAERVTVQPAFEIELIQCCVFSKTDTGDKVIFVIETCVYRSGPAF